MCVYLDRIRESDVSKFIYVVEGKDGISKRWCPLAFRMTLANAKRELAFLHRFRNDTIPYRIVKYAKAE